MRSQYTSVGISYASRSLVVLLHVELRSIGRPMNDKSHHDGAAATYLIQCPLHDRSWETL